ncbi:MAG: 3-phosphoserine/phosphohydroxythreonine aminotransferase [Planctomycetaceae bacterium]|nr:3-phosphoserine/phosphohydroxythreonine aminotransferase [Planctomycetaceae bacterium]
MTVDTAIDRVFNFSAGPAVLPVPVLEEAQRDLLSLPGCGASILEISHRSKQFIDILDTTEQRLRDLIGIPPNYRVVFLQGGSRLQFSMVPMNLLRGSDKPADYVICGSWGNHALKQAKLEGDTRVAWDGKETNYDRLPVLGDLGLDATSAYVHVTSNETIQGIQFAEDPPECDATFVCDASSDFMHRPIDVSRYGLIYACAQKNAGPAGVTIVIIREDLLDRGQDTLPGYVNYKSHVDAKSLYNTPPTFGVYIVGLVAKWLSEDVGGLAKMHQRNRDKAKLLYDLLDASPGFYRSHAQPGCRSLMNVTFRLPSEELESAFISEAATHQLTDLKGHRSVGGIRASIYNAMPVQGVQALREFMIDFRDRHAS